MIQKITLQHWYSKSYYEQIKKKKPGRKRFGWLVKKHP